MHGGLRALHAQGLAKPGLDDRAAADADLLDITRPPAALARRLRLQPLPAVRMPQVLPVVTAIADKLDVLRPGDGLGVDFKLGHADGVSLFFVVKREARTGAGA